MGRLSQHGKREWVTSFCNENNIPMEFPEVVKGSKLLESGKVRNSFTQTIIFDGAGMGFLAVGVHPYPRNAMKQAFFRAYCHFKNVSMSIVSMPHIVRHQIEN